MSVFQANLYHDGASVCDICPECGVEPEALMPIPKSPPLHLDGRECCFDCAAAKTLMSLVGVTFEMARTAVANERRETLRMPAGMSQDIGLVRVGITKPASLDDLDAHIEWLAVAGVDL